MESLNIVFREREKVEVIKENEDPLKSDEVLCAADKSLISIGTELFSLKGVFDPGSDWEEEVIYPYYPGYSMSARIIEVGNDVKGLKIGDRVLCVIPHKQYFTAKPNRLHLIPEQIDSERSNMGFTGSCNTDRNKGSSNRTWRNSRRNWFRNAGSTDSPIFKYSWSQEYFWFRFNRKKSADGKKSWCYVCLFRRY